VRLGWSHGDQEIFSLNEMIDLFDIHHINKAPSTFNTEKLNWLNQHYLKSISMDALMPHLQWHIEQQQLDLTQGPDLAELLTEYSERVFTLKAFVSSIRCYYHDVEEFDPKAAKKHLRPVAKAPLLAIKEALENITLWDASHIQIAIQKTANELGINLGKIGMPLRVAITGAGMSPAIELTLFWAGQIRTLKQIDKAINWISKREANTLKEA
jgi:glutamyl-tRNA synthetase